MSDKQAPTPGVEGEVHSSFVEARVRAGEALRAWCIAHHGSVRKAAFPIGVSRSMLGYLCNGQRWGSAETRSKVFQKTGIQLPDAPGVARAA